MSTSDKIKQLTDKFSYTKIKWLVDHESTTESNNKKYAKALPYIDARDVQNRLDDVMGPQNWKVEYEITAAGHVICSIAIKLDGEWISKQDGAAMDTRSTNKSMNAKAGFSEAFKRAGVVWGIGRYLYDYVPSMVELNVSGGLAYIPKLPDDMLVDSEKGTEQEVKVAPAVAEPAKVVEATVEKTTPVVETPAPAAPVATPVVSAAEQKSALVAEAAKIEKETATPVAQAESSDTVEGSVARPQNLSPEEEKAVADFEKRFAKVAPSISMGFLNSDAAKSKLSQASIDYLTGYVKNLKK